MNNIKLNDLETIKNVIGEAMDDMLQQNSICNYVLTQSGNETYVKNIHALDAYMQAFEMSQNGNVECYMAALGKDNKAARPVFSVVDGVVVLSGQKICRITSERTINDMNKDILKKPVDVIDNGKRKHFDTREEAAELYLAAMAGSDGSAKNRYATIYTQLVNGTNDVVSDGEPELKERPKFETYSLDDTDKIIKLIETNAITIHDLYDVKNCKLKVDDRDVRKALLKKDGWYAAQYMRKEIENDRELIMIAGKGGKEPGATLGYADDELCNDKEFVIDLIKEVPTNFRYASVILKNDPEVVSVALNAAFNSEKTFNLDVVKNHIGTELLVLGVNAYLEKIEKTKYVDVIQELKEELLPQLQQNQDGYGNPIGFVSFGEETIELIFDLDTAQYSATVHDKEGNPQLPHINGHNLDDILMDCVTNYNIIPERELDELEEKNSLDDCIAKAKEDVKPAKNRSNSKEKTK